MKQIDALLEVDLGVIGLKVHTLLSGSVSMTPCRCVNMLGRTDGCRWKRTGKTILRGGCPAPTLRNHKSVLAVDAAAIGRQGDAALMQQAITFGITVMLGPDAGAYRILLARDPDTLRPVDDRGTDGAAAATQA